MLVKFFDNLFESCYVCLAELEQIFQVQDEYRQVASPINPMGESGLS